MTEAASDPNNFPMKLRTRRSALADIGNIFTQISDATKKVTSGKRKSLGSKSEETAVSALSSTEPSIETVVLTSNPVGDKSESANKVQKVSASSTPGAALTHSVALVGSASKTKKILKSAQQLDPDPAKCMKSIDEMYDIYLDLEARFSPKPYMHTQVDINYKMRAILVDWLVEIHSKFKLQTSTLFLCVNIMDRFLQREQIVRSKLQLIGVSSLLIACKFEEVFPPLVKDCIYITDHAYDQQELLKTESKILTVLDYQVLVPTAYHFLIRYLNAIKASERTRQLTSYYSERNLQESETLTVTSHVYAAACVYASLKQQNDQYHNARSRPVWPLVLEEMTGLKETDLIPTAKAIIKHCGEEPETSSKRKLIATKRKYALSKHGNVSELMFPKFI